MYRLVILRVNFKFKTYIDSIPHEGCQPNLKGIYRLDGERMLYIEHFYHMVQLVYKDLSTDFQCMPCYHDIHCRVDIHLFWLKRNKF